MIRYYDDWLEEHIRLFEQLQQCQVCQGHIPEECDGDHSNTLLTSNFQHLEQQPNV